MSLRVIRLSYRQTTPAKAATCTESGNTAYWYCTKCENYYSNASGSTKIALAETVIAKLPHSFTLLKHDADKHWYQCADCTEADGLEVHKGGTATCTEKAKCSVCDTEYGNLSAHQYTETVDAKYIKFAATCTDKAVYFKSCSACGLASTETFAYGTVDSTNHVGGTYKNEQKEASCYEEGYTGDIHCSGCDAIITDGSVIEKNTHNPASVWSTDADNHWKECQTVGCGNIIDKAAHSGGEATCIHKPVCSVCGVEYGEPDAANHEGITETRNAAEAACSHEGYTGDTYCKACDEKISSGTAATPRLLLKV